MSDNKQATAVQYRTARWWEMLLAPASSGNNICMYMCMVYATQVGSQGFGISTITVGVIITLSRILDAVTDAAIAYVFEKFPIKYGKCRPFLLIGWGVESLAVFLMFHVAVNRFDGLAGIVMFVLIYVVYIIGYTINNMGGYVMPSVLTNDPKQRPMVSFFMTIFSYGTPIVLNNIITFNILPRHNNQYDIPMLKEMTALYIGVAFVCCILAIIGISRGDKAEVWAEAGAEIAGKKQQKVGIKEMWQVLSQNKDVQRYIVTCATDKFAQTTSTQSVIMTLLSGVLIGSYGAVQIANNYASAVGLLFAFAGGIVIGKIGSKKGTVWFSWAATAVSAVQLIVCIGLGPDGMKQIGEKGSWAFVLWIVCTVGMTATRMLLSVAANTMRPDVVDGEEYRSGNFMPSVVSGVYSLIDKGMSSICSTFANICIALVGYAHSVPQMGDKVTPQIFYVTLFLSFGLPILGFVCNLLAMRKYTLDPETLAQVQAHNQKMRDERAEAEAS